VNAIYSTDAWVKHYLLSIIQQSNDPCMSDLHVMLHYFGGNMEILTESLCLGHVNIP
jgi:hypothetical protein